MDRRQRKTRFAIFNAFTGLLSQKDFSHITVGEIIEAADVGRATFYSHFETKDYLLKEYCQELFCHIFDMEQEEKPLHSHIFTCDGADSVFLHLIRHLQKNDNHILTLLSTQNNELFLKYFRTELEKLVDTHFELFDSPKFKKLPRPFLQNYVTVTFVETIKWWLESGMQESPEVLTEYFFAVI